MLGLLLVLVLCAAGAVQAASQELLENVSVVRQVSLEAQIVRELLSVNFTNVGTSPASFYLLPVEHQGHLAHLQVSPKKDMTSQIPFTLVVEGGSQYAKISVGPVAPGKSSQFFAHLAYTHVLEPHPKEIPQTEKQQMLYRGNVYLSSPYPTLKIKTSFSIPTSEGTSTDKALTLTGNKFSFGPATDRLEPFSRREATIHYKNNNPFLVTEKLVRTVEVSHWGGNVAFEESYSTIHAGAKLKGFYSRLDFDHSLHRHAETPVIKKIDLSLPIGAADVYYRDAIGNVSTSHFFGNAFESTLELMPRYPLFGGWKTEWSHGYNLPLSNALQKTPQGSYALNILFVAPYSDAVIDDFTLLVILPEGATNIRFVSENDLGADVQIEHIQTYLDTFGRPTVKATKKNVINEHRVPIQIQYDFPAVMMLQEPMLLNGFFFVLFFTAMVVSRIDLSIEKH